MTSHSLTPAKPSRGSEGPALGVLLTGLLCGACSPLDQGDGGAGPLSHAFTLSRERDLEASGIWPVGELTSLAETDVGVLVGLNFAGEGLVMRMLPDGGSGPPLSLGRGSWAGPQLTATNVGIIASFESRRNTVSTRLLDPGTGEPLGESVLLPTITGLRRWQVTGAPGRVLWATQVSGNPDGGWLELVRPLTEDGRDPSLGPPVDVTAWGTLVGLHTGLGAHWAMFSAPALDGGGPAYQLARLADDGTPTSVAPIPATAAPVLTTTASRLFVAWQDQSTSSIDSVFLTPAGATTLRAAFPSVCGSLTAASQGEEVWLTCVAEQNSLLRLVFSQNAAPVSTVLLEGDGGTLVAGPVAPRRPLQLFQRQFQEIGRGNHRAAHSLPLDSAGRTAIGPSPALLLRGTSQFDVGFASAGAEGPHALVWYDDRQLPRQPMLRTTLFSALGEPEEGARWLPGPTLVDLASGFELQRTIAGNEHGFLLVSSNGYDVHAVSWPADAGPPAVALLTPTFGTRSQATICGDDAGFVATWAQLFPRVAQRFDSSGQLVGSTTPLGDSPQGELLCAREHLLLARGGDRLTLDWLSRDLSRLDGGSRALPGGPPNAIRMARDEAVAMVAWETVHPTNRGLRRIFATRLWLDGGAALDDVPLSLEVPSGELGAALRDVAAAGGRFYLLGREASDAGDTLWVWPVPAQGQPEEPRVSFAEVRGVSEVAAGPVLRDGGLLLAYSRAHPELGPSVSRVHHRVLGGDSLGEVRHPPRLLAVGCSSAGDLPPDWGATWAALALLTIVQGAARRARPC